ncbi:MAG: hypothetical protein ABH800_00825 [Candidatus Nealsonbacteria bacterium]
MLSKKKKIARELRKKGWSLNEIKEKLKVAKSSVSIWVRDIELTKKQRQKLSKNKIKKEVIEKRRETRLKRESAKREIVINTAKHEVKNLSKRKLWLIGTALYWGEGSKVHRGSIQFSNADPRMIQLMMRFFRKCCKVPESKFRGHIHIHPHLDEKKALKYWHNISGIPINQFFKTSTQQSKKSKNKKDTLPFGTFNITICNTELFLKIKGWIEKICEIYKIKILF